MKTIYEYRLYFLKEHGWIVLWTFFELRDGHILIQAPKSALRHAFGINDPLLGRNESERQLLRTVSHYKSSSSIT